jgi:uncharacterized glyoxalase superfamily protein PhnB
MSGNQTIFQNAAPVFLVGDIEQATEFYEEVLGFEKKWSWPDGRSGDPVIRIGLAPANTSNMGDFEIHLIENPMGGPSGTSFIYFTVKNVEQIYENCQKAGADIYLELGDRDWGMNDFRVLDPFGNRLGFGEPLKR